MSVLERLKNRIKPLLREEQTTISGLLMLRALTELNCLVYQWRYRSLKKKTREGMAALRNSGAESVFVFANGPSVSDIDLKKIKRLQDTGEYDLITVNCFAAEAMKEAGIKPTVSVFADPAHYRTSDDPLYDEKFQRDIDSINTYKVPALVPYRYFSQSRFDTSIPYSGVRNVYSRNVRDLTKPLGVYYVTALHAIIAAFHLGYKNVYICGYDNSYFKSFGVDEGNLKFFEDAHFYDKDKVNRRYMPEGQFGSTSHVFYNTYRHFKYLEKLQKMKPKGVEVFNVAKHTYTDAFPRCFDLDIYTEHNE